MYDCEKEQQALQKKSMHKDKAKETMSPTPTLYKPSQMVRSCLCTHFNIKNNRSNWYENETSQTAHMKITTDSKYVSGTQ